jgi:hypothetical protein
VLPSSLPTPSPTRTCSHSVCVTGEPLDSVCDVCAASISAAYPHCQTTVWDDVCVNAVASVCGRGCSKGCQHIMCITGGALSPNCNGCVYAVTAHVNHCAYGSWNLQCIAAVAQYCHFIC